MGSLYHARLSPGISRLGPIWDLHGPAHMKPVWDLNGPAQTKPAQDLTGPAQTGPAQDLAGLYWEPGTHTTPSLTPYGVCTGLVWGAMGTVQPATQYGCLWLPLISPYGPLAGLV